MDLNQIRVKPASLQDSIVNIIVGSTCSDPYSNSMSCQQTSAGQPLSSWDQSVCGCHEDYMARYQAGTWVTLNDIDGLTCTSDQPSGDDQSGGAQLSKATQRMPGTFWLWAACSLMLLRV